MPTAAALLIAALLLAACVTGYSRETPMGVYPGGELSGPPTHFVGVRLRFSAPPRNPPAD